MHGLLKCLVLFSYLARSVLSHRIVSVSQIARIAEQSCVLAVSLDFQFPVGDVEIWLENFTRTFEAHHISVVYTNFHALLNDKYVHVKITNAVDANLPTTILAIPRKFVDRTCLYKPVAMHEQLTATSYGETSPKSVFDLLQFVNENCDSNLDADGHLTKDGLAKRQMLNDLYSVKTRNNKVSMSELVEQCGEDLRTFFYTGTCRNDEKSRVIESEEGKRPGEEVEGGEEIQLPKCDVVFDNLDQKTFEDEILRRSKPTIFKGLASNWPARTKWTNGFFRKKFGDVQIHVKLTPTGIFEGVEEMSMWNKNNNQKSVSVPDEVLREIRFPDFILVRPAGVEMSVGEFVDLVEKSPNGYFNSSQRISAYIEYTHLADYFKTLEMDVGRFPFADLLQLKHLNFWFSDGDTLGKLHFDEFDNFLCQIKGRKQLILFEPHENRRLYESYIIEGELSFENGSFARSRLTESTALTMSPVNVVQPNFQKFPEFADALPLNCTIDEGDVLFMPAFWWHEVQSYPNEVEKRNLAVNYWYEPYFTKEFPCADCPLRPNPTYHRLRR